MRINKKDKKDFIFSLYGHKQHKVLLHMLNCVRNISLGLQFLILNLSSHLTHLALKFHPSWSSFLALQWPFKIPQASGRAELQEGFLTLGLHWLPKRSMNICCLANMFLAQASWSLRSKQWLKHPRVAWEVQASLIFFQPGSCRVARASLSGGSCKNLQDVQSLCSAPFPMDCTRLAVVQ